MEDIKKINPALLSIISIIVFAISFLGAPYIFAQTQPTNFGDVYNVKNKNVIETPWGGSGTSPYTSSSCPDGSVLVGFNLINVGSNYSIINSLYCRAVLSAADSLPTISWGTAGPVGPEIIEENTLGDWNDDSNPNPSCINCQVQ